MTIQVFLTPGEVDPAAVSDATVVPSSRERMTVPSVSRCALVVDWPTSTVTPFSRRAAVTSSPANGSCPPSRALRAITVTDDPSDA